MQDEIFSARMGARLINMKPSTMQSLLKNGKIKAEMVGDRTKVRLSTLCEFSGASPEMLRERLKVFKDEIKDNLKNRTSGVIKAPTTSSNRLTDEQRASIRKRYTGKHGEQTVFAREYGVSQTYIWKIVHNVPNAR